MSTIERKIKPRYRWTILGDKPAEVNNDIPINTEFPPGNNAGMFSPETWYFGQGWDPHEWEWIINVWPTMNPQLLWVEEHTDSANVNFHLFVFCNSVVWGVITSMFVRSMVNLFRK